MRFLAKVARLGVYLLLSLVTLAVAWLAVMPPELLRVGTGYAAKMVCSNVFLVGRDSQDVLEVDVQAPGHPLLRLVGVDVDDERGWVTARMAGVFAGNAAFYRPGLGCAVAPEGEVDPAAQEGVELAPISAPDPFAAWPGGQTVAANDPRLSEILSDPRLVGPGMRAVIVVKNGQIVGEAYGEGFDAETRLLGWSMTKTVTATIMGRMVAEGLMTLDAQELFAEWTDDGRAEITLADLLAMESGLDFDESYGSVTDVTRMLYLERTASDFALSRPLKVEPGSAFNYSSGETVILSRYWMSRFPSLEQAQRYPHEALFKPLGMRSAILEADAAGIFVGSSYMYATARDWARIGMFLANDGVWNGERLLPEGFVDLMRAPNGTSNGAYSKMQTWFLPPGQREVEAEGLPEDVFWMRGHDGQSIAISSAENLVVVRLGLTPVWRGYRPAELVRAVRSALQ